MTQRTRDGREVAVVDNPEDRRFEARIGDELVGRAVYRTEPGVVVFTHTEVEPGLQGQGIAQVLAQTALDQVRAGGRRVVPLCPFISGYIDKHPEYADLVG